MEKIILPCGKGCEQVLADEAQSLGLQSVKIAPAVVQGIGELEVLYRLCLWSRVASRVLMVLTEQEISSPDALYACLHSIAWDDHISPDGTFAVRFSGTGCGINNTQFGALKAKDGIVDKLREIYKRRPDVDAQNPDVAVDVHLRKGILTVALDVSGGALHQRGYRVAQGAAPIKESLAATLLYRAKFPETMHNYAAVIDPMCGSGTLLLEALLMCADIAPGLYRHKFGFEHWQSHRPTVWQKLRTEAEHRAQLGLENLKIKFYGFDADKFVLQAARRNAQAIGLAEQIHFQQADIQALTYRHAYGKSGILVSNPPYGERLGELPELLPIYSALGQAFKTFPDDWQMALITNNDTLVKRMKCRAAREYQAFNGPIASKIYLYERASQPEKAEAMQTAKIENASLLSESAQMFANRLKKNIAKLDKWAQQQGTNAYRIYDQDLPEYAVAIDRYADWVLIQEYKAPKDIPEAKAEQRLLDVIQATPSVLGISAEKIILKTRQRQSGKQQYTRLAENRDELIVQEGSAKFYVNLKDYLDTGLFLDHRPMRRRIFLEAKDKKVLNLFCYTASVSVQAALGGALYTTSVDLSQTYLDWAWRNFDLNELSSRHRIERGDVMEWLIGGDSQYDLIFCDPPTFSNTKKTQRVFDVQNDQTRLIERCMRRLVSHGTLYFSNNYRGFKFDAAIAEKYNVQEISAETIDLDFKRRPNIHRVWKIQHA